MKVTSNLFLFLFLLLCLGACNKQPRTFPSQEELVEIMDKAVNESDLPAVVEVVSLTPTTISILNPGLRPVSIRSISHLITRKQDVYSKPFHEPYIKYLKND